MAVAELYDRAASQFRAGDVRGAEQHCRRILSDSPDDPSTLNLLGTLLRVQGRLEEGLELSQRAVAGQPESSFFLFNLGDCLRVMGRLDDAIRAYQRSLSLEPSPHAFAALGNAFLRLGVWPRAADSFRNAILLRPRDAGSHVGLARALNATSKFDKAADAARGALVVDQHNAAAHAHLAIALKHLGQITAAAEEFERAIEIYPQDFESMIMLATIEPERLPGWLMNTAENVCLHLCRSARRRRSHEQASVRTRPETSDGDDNADTHEQVLALLAGLPEDEQTMLRLRFLEGQSWGQVSQHMDGRVSAATLCKHFERLRQQLRHENPDMTKD